MKRIDSAVNKRPIFELKELLFQGSWDTVALKDESYEKLTEILSKRPIHNRKICLISPPQFIPEAANITTALNKRYQDYPPLGLLSLSSAVRHFLPLWNVEMIDLNLETIKRTALNQEHDYEKILELIPDDCDVYGVSGMFEASQAQTVRCMEYLVNRGKFVISGGVQNTVVYKDLLKRGYCDIVIKKEGETQLIKLLTSWEDINKNGAREASAKPIFNLAFNWNKEIVEFEDKFENPVSLDIRKEYGRLDLDSYNTFGAPTIWCRIGARGKKWATTWINRGCRGHCTFCQVSDFLGQGVRSRAADDIVDEIMYFYHELGVRHIEFVDDDFLGNRAHAEELLQRIKDLKIDLTFSIGSGMLAIKIDEEIAKALADAGCIMTGFGVETGNPERLKTLRKPISLDNVRVSCDIFKKNHRQVWLQANFMLGFPNETYEEMWGTFNFANSLKIDYCQSSILLPIKDTRVYDEFVQMNDDRVIDSFGKETLVAATIGRALQIQGLTFDDFFPRVYDFRTVDMDKVPNQIEIQQFQIYFNVFNNLVGSPNLKPDGMPQKVIDFTDDVLSAYPMCAASWAANSYACKLLGKEEKYEKSLKNCRKALDESRFWAEFFEIYDVKKLMDIS